MEYNKVTNKTQDKDINYLNKDFNSYRNQLLDFAQTYFPNTFNDFSESSPGMMFIEMAAYVGDVLSFYTDTQIRETFLSTATEKESIFNIAYAMGYKPKVTTAASTKLEIFHLIPTTGPSYEPDYDYALQLNANSTFTSNEGVTFYTTDKLDFRTSGSLNPTEINIYQYDSSNNPQYYLIKKSVNAISGERKTKEFAIGAPEQFLTLTLFDTDVISIEKIEDSDGNLYYEVPYLAQDTIFEEIENTAAVDPELHQYNQQTPFLLKLRKVPRRFISRFKADNTLEIQFGAGISDKADEEIIPNPDNIGLGIKDGRNKLDVAYDPSNFLYTRAYGQVPANTTLTVTYIRGGGTRSNVNSNTIINNGILNIINKPNLNASLVNFVRGSIACSNPAAASGGGGGDSLSEIKMNVMANFSAQNRTVTKNDYLIRTLSMPPMFGRVAKAYITQDDQLTPLTTDPGRIPNPSALNLYTLGYDLNKKLINLNQATKQNLATYLEQHRMLTDAINIKNAFVINFGLEFEITVFKNFNNQETLLNCITEISNYFKTDKWQINQPIITTEIKNLIGGVRGVQTLEDLRFHNINDSTGIGYSQYKYDFKAATRSEVIYPSLDLSIFELKYPNADINGRVTTY